MTRPSESHLGVDVGTTHTVAALVGVDGRSQPLLFDASFLLPSAVYAESDGRLLVGKDAERSARLDPTRFEPNPKRRIDEGSVLLGAREYPVPDLLAALLRRTGDEAARVAGMMPARTVLTYPANWATSRRGVLAEAAARAGLPAVTLVPEPIAAAAYFTTVLGRAVAPGGVLVVYDFGGGTFDTSILRRRPDNGWDVLASDGLPDVGGVDLDAAIVEHLGRTLGARDAQQWRRLIEPDDDVARRRNRMLRDDVRAAKEQLSRASSAAVHVPVFDTDVYLTREEFEQVARPYLQRTVDLTAATLQRAGVRPDQLAGLFLVGGSSRIPLVSTLLHHRLGSAPTLIEQPELVVALGSVLAVPTVRVPRPPVTAPPWGQPPMPPGPSTGPSSPVSTPTAGGSSPISAPVPGPVSPSAGGPPPSWLSGIPPEPGASTPVSAPPEGAAAFSSAQVSGPPTSGGPTSGAPPGNGAGTPPVWHQPGSAGVKKASSGRRTALLAGIAVVLVLLAGVGGVQAWRAVSDNDDNPGAGSGRQPGVGDTVADGAQPNTKDAPAGAPQQSVEVNKSAWYAGLKLTFGMLTYDATKKQDQLSVAVQLENLADKDERPNVNIIFAVGGQQYQGNFREGTTVGAGTKSNMNLDFDVRTQFTGSIATGVFTIGRGDEARAVVPVGKGDYVPYEPKGVLKDVKVTHRDLVVTFTECDLRGGFFSFHGQAKKDYLALTCRVNLQYTGGSGAGHYVGEGNFRLGLPDGTEIGPTVAPNEALYSANTEPGTYLGFMIKTPVAGKYVLRVVDVHGGEKRAPNLVHETPLTLQ